MRLPRANFGADLNKLDQRSSERKYVVDMLDDVGPQIHDNIRDSNWKATRVNYSKTLVIIPKRCGENSPFIFLPCDHLVVTCAMHPFVGKSLWHSRKSSFMAQQHGAMLQFIYISYWSKTLTQQMCVHVLMLLFMFCQFCLSVKLTVVGCTRSSGAAAPKLHRWRKTAAERLPTSRWWTPASAHVHRPNWDNRCNMLAKWVEQCEPSSNWKGEEKMDENVIFWLCVYRWL